LPNKKHKKINEYPIRQEVKTRGLWGTEIWDEKERKPSTHTPTLSVFSFGLHRSAFITFPLLIAMLFYHSNSSSPN
jgi:hypothetical protein